MNDFDEYLVAGEPSKRDRAYGWATAIGLQDVDGLKVSAFLLNTAKRNIEGEITQSEAGKIIDAYYETKEGRDQPEDRKEADKVARRINEVINSPSFRFSPEYYIGLHGRLFRDVFPHSGKMTLFFSESYFTLPYKRRYPSSPILSLFLTFTSTPDTRRPYRFQPIYTSSVTLLP